MATTERLTPEQIRDIEPPKSGQFFLWESATPGFGLRVTAGGDRSFVLQYRWHDPAARRASDVYRFTFGKAKLERNGTGLSIGDARKEADKWIKEIDRGTSHPLAHRRGNREAVKAARDAETFKQAFAEYIEHEQNGRKGNSTAGEVERAVLKDCTEWFDWPVKDVGAKDIGKLLRKVRDGGGGERPRPYMANHLFAYLSTFLRWCAKPDVAKIPASPMVGMSKPWEGEEVRDRVFNDKELKAIWRAADEIGGTAGAFVKVLLLTGKRSGKTNAGLASMKRADLDADGLWTPPVDPRRRKRTKRLHAVPLPKLARRIIAPLRPKEGDQDNPYVFPGRDQGTHIFPGNELAQRIKDKSGVADFYYHALRHTLETRLAELGVLPHIRDLIMDHAPMRGSGAGYDHHHYGPEMADALERWAAHIEKLVSPKGVSVLR